MELLLVIAEVFLIGLSLPIWFLAIGGLFSLKVEGIKEIPGGALGVLVVTVVLFLAASFLLGMGLAVR